MHVTSYDAYHLRFAEGLWCSRGCGGGWGGVRNTHFARVFAKNRTCIALVYVLELCPTCPAAGSILGRRNPSANWNPNLRSFATRDPTLPNGRHSFDPEQTLRPIASTIAAAKPTHDVNTRCVEVWVRTLLIRTHSCLRQDCKKCLTVAPRREVCNPPKTRPRM